MTVTDGKITAATDRELYEYWLRSDWCEIMSYPDYKRRLRELGVAIKNPDNFKGG